MREAGGLIAKAFSQSMIQSPNHAQIQRAPFAKGDIPLGYENPLYVIIPKESLRDMVQKKMFQRKKSAFIRGIRGTPIITSIIYRIPNSLKIF